MHDAFADINVFPVSGVLLAIHLDARLTLADEHVFLRRRDALIVAHLVDAIDVFVVGERTSTRTVGLVIVAR